jgi:hypothetical protein
MDELDRLIARLESMVTTPEERKAAGDALEELRAGAECMRLSEQAGEGALEAVEHALSLREQAKDNLERAAEHLRRVNELLDAAGLAGEE